MDYRAYCEECRRVLPFHHPGAPGGWTFIRFCSIPCLTEWKRKRFTPDALKAS